MDEILSTLMIIGLFVLFIGIPILLTIINLYNFLVKKKKLRKITEFLTLTLGPIFTVILYYNWNALDWKESLIDGGFGLKFHAPISPHYILTIVSLSIISIVGYCILRIKKTALPPLIIVFCISAIYIGYGLSIVWLIQLLPNINEVSIYIPLEGYLIFLFPLNYIILSISIIKNILKDISDYSFGSKSKLLSRLEIFIKKGLNLPIIALLALFPLLGICIGILFLFGQQPDAIVEAFTDTSDWLLSTKVSPPPIEYEGHYLCTVAAGGHKELVKPQRIGVRHGYLIIVNRQLCVANAFEELIYERTPRFHRFLRNFYDKYGYPISKHIKTPLLADVTYILMKPLEWFFLIVLYMFDVNPENRIAKQYLPIIKPITKN